MPPSSFFYLVLRGINMLPLDYVVFDIETTGFTPNYAEIIEIGALKCRNAEITDEFHSYICPDCGYIPRAITNLTGITYSMVCDSPGFEDTVPAFIEFVGNMPVVGHNVRFDMRFIQTYARACSWDFEPSDVIDTVPLARKKIKDIPNHKLETIKQYFDIDLPSHNALDDCRVTQYLFEYCR